MGRIETFTLSVEPLGQSPRLIYVYLPDGYDRTSDTYPVLYMFDGHNLFDDATATYGKSWGLRDYLDRTHLPLVIIGQTCNFTGDTRLMEYCPLPIEDWRWFPKGEPCGDITADWFVHTLKPFCEKRYRICRDRGNIGIGGSSMGGLMSMYCVAKYNRVYSRAACLSPTMDVNLNGLLETIRTSKIAKDTKVYMDYGSNERDSKEEFALCMERMLKLNHAFQERQCSTFPYVDVNGFHSEASWETRIPIFLEYLFPQLYEKEES